MLWLTFPALAGRVVQPLLPSSACSSDHPDWRELARRRAEDEWRAIGFPEGTTALEVYPAPVCCAAMVATPVDADRKPLGNLWLNTDCSVLGWRVGAGRRVLAFDSGLAPVDPAPGPPTASSALVTAWSAVHDQPDVTGETWYAVPVRRGWDVWITRWWGFDALTTAVVRVEGGEVQRVRRVIRPWVLPDRVDAARSGDTFQSDPWD